MSVQECLESFFSRSFENYVQEAFLDDVEYDIPLIKIQSYVRDLINIPYKEFLPYASNLKMQMVSSSDITQCSSIQSCTETMCFILYEEDNRGKTFLEIGSSPMFSNIVKSSKSFAKTKYGENQTKTAQQLGLAFQYYDRWYLSALGYVYPDFPPKEQQKLLARTILRNSLYASIILTILEHDVDLVDYMQNLAISTQGRRAKSIIILLEICFRELDNSGIKRHNLYYPVYVAKTKTLISHVIQGTFQSLL